MSTFRPFTNSIIPVSEGQVTTLDANVSLAVPSEATGVWLTLSGGTDAKISFVGVIAAASGGGVVLFPNVPVFFSYSPNVTTINIWITTAGTVRYTFVKPRQVPRFR